MTKRNHKELLDKIIRVFTSHNSLSNAKNLDQFEEAILERLEAGILVFAEVADVYDELWEIHKESCTARGGLEVAGEEKVEKRIQQATNRGVESGLGLGVGMAVGGVFDYLKSPQNVEDHLESSEEIAIVSEEELALLEEEFEEVQEESSLIKNTIYEATKNLEIPEDQEQREELEEYLEDTEVVEEDGGEALVDFLDGGFDLF